MPQLFDYFLSITPGFCVYAALKFVFALAGNAYQELLFTLLEGCVAAFVYIRAGLLGATLTHGLAIAALATGLV